MGERRESLEKPEATDAGGKRREDMLSGFAFSWTDPNFQILGSYQTAQAYQVMYSLHRRPGLQQ